MSVSGTYGSENVKSLLTLLAVKRHVVDARKKKKMVVILMNLASW